MMLGGLMTRPLPGPGPSITLIVWNPLKKARLRDLALKAYWAAATPTEIKMAGILMDMFARDVRA